MANRSWLIAMAALVICCAEARAFEAGAAKVEITPPLGTPLAGYDDRHGRGALTVHDPLWARCLYLTDGETAAFVVSADLCFITRELRARVLELLPQDIAKENVILTATHTHNGSGGLARNLFMRQMTGRFMPELLDQTARSMVEAMRLAREAKKRAAIGYGVCEPNDLIANRREPGGPIDPQIGLLRVDDADGTPITVAACMAGHPTLLGAEHRYAVSADYPGVFCRAMEEAYGTTCVPMFLNGAEGNQRPVTPSGTSGWAEIEAVGGSLAAKVKPIIDTIKCADVKIHLGYATPELPRTTAAGSVPTSAVLHTLEIGDLLMAFVPGEPCVEIGLELRKRALDRGYAQAMVVGLADDYLAYFVPAPYCSQIVYETSMSFYGPRMPEWLYGECGKLMTRGTPAAARPEPEAAKIETLDCGDGSTVQHVILKGSAYDIGYQRGAAFRELVAGKYAADIVGPLDSGALLPTQGFWRAASKYINATPMTLRMLAVGVRPLLQGLSPELFDEVDGLADGAKLPFDAAWLVQCAPTMAARPDRDAFYRAPYCTMFATTGDRAGASDIMVARNFDWESTPGDAQTHEPIVFEVRPDKGRRFFQVGFPWAVGVFTGMNDAGLSICAERVEPLGPPPADRAPLEMVLRDLLQNYSELDAAVTALAAHTELAGYHVLVAGTGGERAAVVEFGSPVAVRSAQNGVLLGTMPETEKADDDAKARYSRVRALIQDEHIVASAKMRSILADRQGSLSGMDSIWNENTRYSIILEPKARTLSIARRSSSGQPGGYAKVAFELPPEPKPAAKPTPKQDTKPATKGKGKGAR